MICVLATCCQCWPGNSCLRNWAHEQLFMCTCIHIYTCMWAIVAERDFSNRFTLTFDARYLFARICCCCHAKLGFISSNDVTAHWQRCTASLSASLSLSQLLFLFWFCSDMATAAWLSNDLVACFFFGATLRPCQCVENCICCGPQ